jgi:hypothetical protein
MRLSKPAVPADLFDHHDRLPNIWIAREPSFVLIGLFNFDEDPLTLRIDLARHGLATHLPIRSFWTNEPIVPRDGIVEIAIAPRSSIGLVLSNER